MTKIACVLVVLAGVACVTETDVSLVKQHEICLECGDGEDDGGGGGTDPMPTAVVLTSAVDWSEPTTTDVSAGETSTYDPDQIDYLIAQSAGELGWLFAQSNDLTDETAPSCGSNGGWIGCQVQRDWQDRSRFSWTCWVKTMFGSAYCLGYGSTEEEIYDDGNRIRIRYRIRTFSGRCGEGVLRC